MSFSRPFCCAAEALTQAKTPAVLHNSWLSDFGGFPMTSSSMTVKSKSVLYTSLVVLASIESVLSEK